MKKIIRHDKKPAEICRFYLVCPLRNHVPDSHYNAKTNMAVIVNKAYYSGATWMNLLTD